MKKLKPALLFTAILALTIAFIEVIDWRVVLHVDPDGLVYTIALNDGLEAFYEPHPEQNYHAGQLEHNCDICDKAYDLKRFVLLEIIKDPKAIAWEKFKKDRSCWEYQVHAAGFQCVYDEYGNMEGFEFDPPDMLIPICNWQCR